jgi:type II secretory pathway pseudopilin PulG
MNPPKFFDINFSRARRSFTLFEAIVAISVILTGLVSVMSLVRMSISTASVFQNRIIASNLAQEGVELARNKATSNLLTYVFPSSGRPCDVADAADPCNPAPFGLSETPDADNRPSDPGPCVSESKTGDSNDIGCYIAWQNETDVKTAKLTFEKCRLVDGECPKLNFDSGSGLYSYDNGAEPTHFVRTIIVDDAGSRIGRQLYEYDELHVISKVKWPTRFGADQELEFSIYISPR